VSRAIVFILARTSRLGTTANFLRRLFELFLLIPLFRARPSPKSFDVMDGITTENNLIRFSNQRKIITMPL
jgi:hypothetical protein